MKKTKIIPLEKYTRLPIRVVEVAQRLFPDIVILTPHKGNVVLKLKEKHIPFLFGSVTETTKSSDEIIKSIVEIEESSKDYLLKKWIESIK